MTLPLPGTLGFNRPPVADPVVDLARRIKDLEDRLSASSRPVIIQNVSTYASSLTFTGSYAAYATSSTYSVPVGYNTLTYVLNVQAGATPTAGSSLGLSVYLGAGSAGTTSIGNGTASAGAANGALSVVTPMAGAQPASGSFKLSCLVDLYAGTMQAGTGNASVNGVLMWSVA